jgi:ABC-type Mn2+/Zn2+ transport system ATPase subunit/Fe-S cluster assembly ATPase SufC
MQIAYKGSRWYKCDLHLHTAASKCFQDQEVTAEQWVDRAIEQGLNSVAVTDHNTGAGIDAIKAAAEGKNLTVFPGVEITCDPSKVHLLILFDVTKTSADIRDFLVRAGIKADDFSKQDAATIESIFAIADLATKDGGIVIPAHIDEYNGLGSISVANLEKFYGNENINAVQVVHKEFLSTSLQTNGNTELKQMLNDYYSNPNPSIDDSTVKEWFTPVKYAIESKLAILTFSDNPHEPKNSKHGLDGIGSRYTWIKMDEIPSLEGLRQAFLLPQFRIKNDFDSPDVPYETPSLWIKSISISNCLLTDTSAVKIEFNPQLNTIIGGRGSGKSSILKFIRGCFNRMHDLSELPDILKDHHDFYKRTDGRPKKGVLNEDTCIEIEFVRNNTFYKITASNITDCSRQDLKIEKYEDGPQVWTEVEDEGYIDFFEFEHYSQKQIYEIAQEPNSLRERIDRSIPGLDVLKSEKEIIKRTFFEKSTAIRTMEQQITGKGKLQTELRDIESRIQLLQQSGISHLLIAKEKYAAQNNLVKAFGNQISNREALLQSVIEQIEIADVDYSTFEETHSSQLKSISEPVLSGLQNIKEQLEGIKSTISTLKSDFDNSITGSTWAKSLNQIDTEFEEKKQELEQQGVNVISNFELLSQEKAQKEFELDRIASVETSLTAEMTQLENLKIDFLNKSKEITVKRRDFLNKILPDDKIKISIRPFRNQNDFIQKIRKIIQREDSFQGDVDYLTSLCFNGNVEQNIKAVREIFLKIRAGEPVTSVSGFFVNLVNSMNEAQLDEIELLLPEDEIEVQYKTSSSSTYKSLSTASAGQKTTAILTFILSYGKLPLILDQPEDDLDNRLVYELVVDRLKQAKQERQIIVVTHNANIPVNGDAEYIISLNSESKLLQVLHMGTVEQSHIKKEICEVMEGGTLAFDMRYRRYKQLQ